MKSFLKGRINNGLTDVDCLIRDLSATGARLVLSGGITMPSVIELHIPTKKQVLRAKVDWRNGDDMGVSFIHDLEETPPVARDHSELAERVVKLEAEAESLFKALVRLRSEISAGHDLDNASAHRRAIRSMTLAKQ